MAQREFCDARGITWIVWEVQPTLAERRRTRVPIPPNEKERRLGAPVRVPVPERFADGWLVFKTAGERRRLAPIPGSWAEGGEDQLRLWCDEASPTVLWSRPITRRR